MARFYRKRRFYRKKNKWSIEQRPGFVTGAGWSTTADGYLNRQALIPIVASTQQEGVRKAKNMTISLATGSNTGNSNYPYYYALIYLPEGQTANELQSQGQLYTPSQFIISSGIVTSEQGKMRITSRLARNLNQGDAIYLLLGTNNNNLGSNSRFDYLVQYAICYN